MFSEEKVTHMASYLLIKRGGKMSYMKLLKLLYLAERESLAKWGESMSGDRFVSMPHGPVMSSTLEMIQGGGSVWDSFIVSEADYEVSLKPNIGEKSLDDLSISETEILDEVFSEFGAMKRWDLVKYTHENCDEWQDPNGSSYPIELVDILRAKGFSNSDASSLIKHGEEQAALTEMKRVLL
jgi:uncharacterized phage-associated protein